MRLGCDLLLQQRLLLLLHMLLHMLLVLRGVMGRQGWQLLVNLRWV